MGKSLQDQLLKAGVANRKQAKGAKKARNERTQLERQGKAGESEASRQAREAREAERERSRTLNRERQAEVERRAVQAQIRELVRLNRITVRGELPYRYTVGTTIHTLHLAAAERDALINGALAIARVDDTAEIVPRQVAEKIRERDPDAILLDAAAGSADEAADDAYADYPVPDDLMW